MLRVGQQAPDFEVTLHTSETFRLRDELGKRHVVLYFYPRDFTIGCTKEACAFTDHFNTISRLNAAIIGVSPDSVETHREFARQYSIAFPLAADPALELARQYDAVWMGGRAMQRVTYVIDRGGCIRLAAHHALFINNHWKRTIDVLQELKRESS